MGGDQQRPRWPPGAATPLRTATRSTSFCSPEVPGMTRGVVLLQDASVPLGESRRITLQVTRRYLSGLAATSRVCIHRKIISPGFPGVKVGVGRAVMAERKSDPTKDPEFQKVIRHFVTTPHQPHEPLGKQDQKERPPSKGRVHKGRTRD
jgi:hypothetical protein